MRNPDDKLTSWVCRLPNSSSNHSWALWTYQRPPELQANRDARGLQVQLLTLNCGHVLAEARGCLCIFSLRGVLAGLDGRYREPLHFTNPRRTHYFLMGNGDHQALSVLLLHLNTYCQDSNEKSKGHVEGDRSKYTKQIDQHSFWDCVLRLDWQITQIPAIKTGHEIDIFPRNSIHGWVSKFYYNFTWSKHITRKGK